MQAEFLLSAKKLFALPNPPVTLAGPLSRGVMVAQRSLEPLVMVRIHAGQPKELILRKQVFQVGLGQASRETFLAQHVSDRLRFALLEVPDLFFDGARCD